MRMLFLGLAALVFTAGPALAQGAGGKKMTPLQGKMKGIDGKDVDLKSFEGKVVLIVNVASRCGYTKQYKGMQALYEKYGKDGFVILGVPANEFGRQEPGTDAEIAEFCKSKYNVTFPMLSKVVVKGRGITPLYQFLTGKDTNPKFAGEIEWNFTKFLIARDGTIVARFEPAVEPMSATVTRAVEAELKK